MELSNILHISTLVWNNPIVIQLYSKKIVERKKAKQKAFRRTIGKRKHYYRKCIFRSKAFSLPDIFNYDHNPYISMVNFSGTISQK